MANSALSTTPPQQHPTPKNSRGKITIREASADLVVLRGAPKSRNIDLPASNQFVQSGERRVVWLAPDEWLIMAEPSGAKRIITALDSDASPATEISNAMGVLDISGKSCRVLLAKYCAIDLDPAIFTAGAAAQTLCGHANVILLAHGDGDGDGGADELTLIGRSSFLPYLVALLMDGGREYGAEFIPAPAPAPA